MKSYVTYILTLFFIFHILDIRIPSILQVSDFWSHYQMHQREFGEDFISFLDLHYGAGKQNHHDEHEEHHSLPFSEDASFSIPIVIFCSHFLYIKLTNILTINNNNNTHFLYSNNYTSRKISEIFQPPRHIG